MFVNVLINKIAIFNINDWIRTFGIGIFIAYCMKPSPEQKRSCNVAVLVMPCYILHLWKSLVKL